MGEEEIVDHHRSDKNKRQAKQVADEQTKHTIEMKSAVLEVNDQLGAENRALLDAHQIAMIDLMSSPGSGKTSTIIQTIKRLSPEIRIGVIEGDISSDVDAQAVKEAGAHAIQINTGGLCHLESNMIRKALDLLPLEELDLIIIENVGNLVCPVDFYLGEDKKIMILSVPEGHDKPLKYPGIFQACKSVLVNKIDTMPVFDFDMEAFRQSVYDLNPHATIYPVSAKTGEGFDEWISEVKALVASKA